MSRLKIIGIVVLVLAAIYGLVQLVDWLIETDEEQIAGQFQVAEEKLQAGDAVGALRELVDLRYAELTVLGLGKSVVFRAGDEELIDEGLRGAGEWTELQTLKVDIDEDRVRVEGENAYATMVLEFSAQGKTYRQQAKAELQKVGERWLLTRFELLTVPGL